jgi:hypothetical protein
MRLSFLVLFRSDVVAEHDRVLVATERAEIFGREQQLDRNVRIADGECEFDEPALFAEHANESARDVERGRGRGH